MAEREGWSSLADDWLTPVALLFILALAVCPHACSDRAWSEVWEEPAFPEAASFLASQGYAAEDYAVLLSWQESARNRPGALVTGYHVLFRETGDTFDLYSDGHGNLLDDADLAALGVRSKNWDLAPVEQVTEIPPAIAKVLPPRPLPAGAPFTGRLGVSVLLPALDVDALLEEDARRASSGEKAAERVGVVRTLPQPIVVTDDGATAGSWQTLTDDGGRLWSVTLVSLGAEAIRVHFSQLRIPAGARVVIYNSRNPVEAYGPYQGAREGETGLWSASCFNEAVTVECCVPPKSEAKPLGLIIDAVTHAYVDFGKYQWTKAAGPCNQDVSCSPEWATTALGVGGYNFIRDSNVLHCTGALVADTDPGAVTPYFLTANHCVGAQSGTNGASSMEFFWLYQTPACGESPPPIADVPRTSGGADLLATAGADVNDFTLVRLREAPPDGVAYIGWTTEPVSVGADVTCIHHPSGDYKRISFGKTSDAGSPIEQGNPIQPYDTYHEVLWSLGTTEHGSSGAPLFLAGNQLVIGQLWGGYASCGNVDEPDYFGRFDKTFPLIEQWLSATFDPMDVDKSGTVNSNDIQLAVNAALGIPIAYDADVDSSGKVDAADVQLVIIAVLNGSE